ncbi:MAG: GNAT family N-acetyltransferase [Anaerolineales bacterium]
MTTKLGEKLYLTLPEGFTVRGARLKDVEPSMEMYNLWAQQVIGEDEINDTEAIRNEWVSPGFDPAEDIRLAYAPDGTLVGYIEVWTTAKPPVHPWIWGRVHPDYNGLGIGSWMLTWAEERAARALDEIPDELRFAPRIGIYSQAKESQKLFKNFGYHYFRSSYRMLIDMDAPPPAPVWPEGLTLQTYNPETDAEAVFRADQDIFRDHFGFVEEPFEEGFQRFIHLMTEYEGFDPSIWWLTFDGDELAGICLCRPHSYDDPDMGYVSTLGVRRPWRKRGLGLAFLHHAFGEFHRRGKRKVGLGVDAENLTGALRLYEKAGMHVHTQFDMFEKEIRPGVEISVQSLGD